MALKAKLHTIKRNIDALDECVEDHDDRLRELELKVAEALANAVVLAFVDAESKAAAERASNRENDKHAMLLLADALQAIADGNVKDPVAFAKKALQDRSSGWV